MCVADDETARDSCNVLISNGATCSLCYTDLCNADLENEENQVDNEIPNIPENSVEKCYYCYNDCEVLQEQTCSDLSHGEKALCITSNLNDGNYYIIVI